MNPIMQVHILDHKKPIDESIKKDKPVMTEMTTTNISSPAVVLKTSLDVPKASFLKKTDVVTAKANYRHLQLITGQKVF